MYNLITNGNNGINDRRLHFNEIVQRRANRRRQLLLGLASDGVGVCVVREFLLGNEGGREKIGREKNVSLIRERTKERKEKKKEQKEGAKKKEYSESPVTHP